MGKSLRQQADEATEYVLDHWKGTSEELGVTVYDAVHLTAEPFASKEFAMLALNEAGLLVMPINMSIAIREEPVVDENADTAEIPAYRGQHPQGNCSNSCSDLRRSPCR